MGRYYETATAIHPAECPCEHCLMHKTVPLDLFVRNANLEDVICIMLSEIENKTFYDEYWLIRHVVHRSPDVEVQNLKKIYP